MYRYMRIYIYIYTYMYTHIYTYEDRADAVLQQGEELHLGRRAKGAVTLRNI